MAAQASRLSSAVAQLLSPGVAGTPFVAALSGGPGASDSHSGAAAAAVQQAQQEQEASLSVQSAPADLVVRLTPSGQPAAGPFLLDDGFMQFEGPTYPRHGGLLSIQSVEDSGGSSGGSGDVRAVLAAAGADPQALYGRASAPDRQGCLLPA